MFHVLFRDHVVAGTADGGRDRAQMAVRVAVAHADIARVADAGRHVVRPAAQGHRHRAHRAVDVELE